MGFKDEKNKHKLKKTSVQSSDIANLQQAWTPNNYMKSKGVCLDDALLVSEWLLPTGVTNARRVTDKKLFESGAILFDATASGWDTITKAINYDFTNVNTIAFAVYVDDQYSLNYINIRMTTNAAKVNNTNDWTSYFETGNMYTSTRLQSGWNLIKLAKSDFANVGAETWGVFRAIRFVIGVPATKFDNSYAGSIADVVTKTTIGVGGIYLNPTHEVPKIMLNFDDSLCYSIIYPYMRQKGIRGTIYLCYNHIHEVGGGNYMTEAQHNEVYAAGWDIGCHSTTHEDMWQKTQAQLEYEWSNVLSYVLSKGWTRGAYFAAYPMARYNSLEMTVLKNLGFKMARGRNPVHIDYITSDMMFGYPTHEIKSTTALATITAWIDKAIERGTDMSLFTHYAVAGTPSDSYGTTTAIWQGVVDYVVTKRDAGLLNPVTKSEYYAGLSNKTITIPNIVTGLV